jgi:putative restriction endonuclease
VERLLADPKTLAAAARLLLDLNFTPALAELICAAVDFDAPALDLAATGGTTLAARLRPRRRGFAEEVLRAYAYQCAMCGFDSALGRYPVRIEAAHGIADGTVQKALRILKDEGLVHTVRGRGVFVTSRDSRDR